MNVSRCVESIAVDLDRARAGEVQQQVGGW